jgi:hypothetical protein
VPKFYIIYNQWLSFAFGKRGTMQELKEASLCLLYGKRGKSLC